MHSFVLQDWITIRGVAVPTTGQTITQGESDWLDLAPYQDLSIWLDVRENTNGPTIYFETSPLKEDGLFQTMQSTSVTSYTNPLRVAITTSQTPVARYVRWRLQGPVNQAWDLTFRVLLSADALGL